MSVAHVALAVDASKGNLKHAPRADRFVRVHLPRCQVSNSTISCSRSNDDHDSLWARRSSPDGTHGTPVAIGVLWLGLMYVRSFSPPPRPPWFTTSPRLALVADHPVA